MSGVLVLVVGPSGVGKDSLIDGARACLAGDPGYVFPRRVITRAADAGGEDHEAVDAPTFAARRDAGAFALHWQAHGIAYGIMAAIADDLAAGRHVIANVSRTVTADAAARFARTRVVHVTATPTTIARRLAARGREDPAAIDARLSRTVAVASTDVTEIANDGPLEEGIARLVSLLRALDT